MNMYDVVNYLANCTDDDFAEVFVRYYYTAQKGYAEDRSMDAEDMRIDVRKLGEDIGNALDEIIYSDEIDTGAWWKGGDA